MVRKMDSLNALWRRPLVVRSAVVIVLYLLMVTRAFGMLPIAMEHIIDLKVFSSSVLIRQDIENQISTGRDAYLVFHLIDYLFIMFFYPLLRQFAKRIGNGGVVLPNLALVAGLMDLVENFWIDAMLLLYPLQLSWMSPVVRMATSLKFLCLAITLVGILGNGLRRKILHNRHH